jgi:hypothetical protein
MTDGARYVDDQATYVIESHALGMALIPTGRVVGCDPLAFGDIEEPFNVEVDPGEYPVRAWVAVLYEGDVEQQRRCAALQLVVRDEDVVRWEPALKGDQDMATLGPDDYFGHGVDAGIGMLGDIGAARAVAAWDQQTVSDVFYRMFDEPSPSKITVSIDAEPPLNAVIVESGWGDGSYPTFVGYTRAGEVAGFVTDFLVVPDPTRPRCG